MADQMPWEKYAATDSAKPWEKYGGTSAPAVPGAEKTGLPPIASPQLGAGGKNTPAALKPTPDNFFTSPNGLIRTGLNQAVEGAEHLAQPGRAAKFSGGSDIIHGLGRAALPAAIPAMAAAPLASATALGAGYLGDAAGRGIARLSGAGPEAEQFAGDVAALPSGMLGGKVGGLASKLAPPLAKSALGIRGTTEAYGADPGKAILEDTRGVRPGSIAKSANLKLSNLNNQLEGKIAASKNTGSIEPARNLLRGKISDAQSANSELTPARLSPMLSQLTEPRPGFTGATEYDPGAFTPIHYTPSTSPLVAANGSAIPTTPKLTYGATPEPKIAADQPASNLLDMKRQFDRDFIRNWNPAADTKGQLGVARQGYSALGNELEKAVPGVSELNQRISSLIPVAKRARLTDMAPGPTERVLDRATRPTGGMFPLLFGLHEGGPLGAAAVAAGQETLGSPAARMIAARSLHGLGKPLGVLPSATAADQR